MSKENNISGGFELPVYGVVTGIPTCNLCKNWKYPSECMYYGECLPEIKKGNAKECKHEDLDKSSPIYKRFLELRKQFGRI